MTDELTPEEKAALESLPRERMPAGLEARVVGAMREHGFLAKPRRMVALTNGRVAGVLAAGVALMVGAYSIGLHRRDGSALLPPTATLQRDEGRLAETPTETSVSKDVAGERTDEAERPATGAVEPERALESKTPSSESMTPPASSGEAEKPLAREPVAEEKAVGSARGEDIAPPERGSLSAQGKLNKSSDQAPRPPAASSPALLSQPRTFFLNGLPVLVEAPDSVRVIQDDQGRMLIIYTSDGIIRIRLAGDD